MRNYSKQREDILSVLKTMKSHLTAEEIYFKVKENNLTASKSTVYRNLKELVDEKIIWKISVSSGPDKYDYPLKDHNHIICNKCDKVVDSCIDFNNNKIQKEIIKKDNMNIAIQTIAIYGICDECKSKL